MSDHAKNLLDGAAVTTALAAFFQLLPALAALASLVWTGIRIYEYVKGKLNGDQRNNNLES